MRAFDWQRLLDEQRIEYVTRGPNVKRGEINIKCPFCGSADPSYHMGLNLDNGWWSCWRRRDVHSGKSPVKLICALLRIPVFKALEIAGLSKDYVDPDGFDAVAARILGKAGPIENPKAKKSFLDFDPSFEPITDKLRTRRHWNYLYGRGFDHKQRGREEVDLLVEQYQLKASIKSQHWAERVIIPFFLDGKLVTWTGRAISPSSRRYRDLELEQSMVDVKETLYNVDAIHDGGRWLVLQEGPFDVLKVDFFGRSLGVRSVGLATNSMSDEQAFLLKMAEGKFERIVIMMDTKSELGYVDSMRMQQKLAFIGSTVIEPVPFGAGDGGALTGDQVRTWASSKF